MRLFIFFALAFVLSGCATLERAALPEPVLLEQQWRNASATATVEIDQTAWDDFLYEYVLSLIHI